jgi:hypothetical protein
MSEMDELVARLQAENARLRTLGEGLAKALTTYAGPIENANNHGTYPQWAIARHRIAGKQLKVIRRALLKEPA